VNSMSQPSFNTSLRVTWVDTDAAGVVHYSNYFRFFERAEEEFYRYVGFDFTNLKERGLWFPRVETSCQYKKPAKYSDMLVIEVSVEELKEKSVKLGFKVVNEKTDDLLAFGHLVIVAADKQTGHATRIPVDIFDKLKPFAKQIL